MYKDVVKNAHVSIGLVLILLQIPAQYLMSCLMPKAWSEELEI